jgi:sulfate permease, SulP family
VPEGRDRAVAYGLARVGKAARRLGSHALAAPGPLIGKARSQLAASRPTLSADLLAGLVASLVTIAYCLSFSALLFQGDLKGGLALGLWALLVGSAVTGVYVAVTTTLPPADAGPDNPAVAVLAVLAGTVSAPLLARGASAELAVTHVLLAFTLATLATGAVLYALGRFRLGQLVRFVPYPVIGGFLAASGWLLITGGIEVVTGIDFDLMRLPATVPLQHLPKIGFAFAFAAALLLLRWRRRNAFIVPICFCGASLVIDLVLWSSGTDRTASGWYLTGSSQMRPWVPLAAVWSGDIEWRLFLLAGAEIGAVAGVTVLALLLDVSSLEVARAKSADLDSEFRTNGLANIVVAPIGGLLGNLSLNASRLLEEAGARTYLSGLFASIAVGLVVVTGFDLPGLVPAPVLAGLLVYLGCLVLSETLLRSPAHRAWTDLALALAITVAIVEFGYFSGVVLGFVGACLLFAFSYSRIGVVRRHLTRCDFASDVERAPEATRLLREQGARIHVFWLTGFIFFGSSNGLFERVRRVIDASPEDDARLIVLDFAGVSGFDTSAVLSLVKLRNVCEERGVTLAYCGLSLTMLMAMEQAKLFGGGQRHQVFPNRNEALAWCEQRLLAEVQLSSAAATAEGFERWLAGELGSEASRLLLASYLERKSLPVGAQLYRQGEPSDTIDLVATGSIAVTVADETGRPLRVRRMAGQTVVGEMGFFRRTARTASVTADAPSLVYTLNRARYESLLAEKPALGVALHHFIIRALADRIEFANQEIAALI